MKKTMMTAVTLVSLSGLASAQSYTHTGLGVTFSGVNCMRVTGTTVDCSLVGTYTATNGIRTGTFFRNTEGKLTLADGTVIIATGVAGGGQDYTTLLQGIEFNKNIPTKLTWRFEGVPANVATLRGVAMAGLAVPNVRLGGTTVIPAPQPVSLDAGSYNAVLTNCKVASGATVCIATLTPRK